LAGLSGVILFDDVIYF